MDDVILVLNAGSSSIKFSLFADRTDQIELKLRGQIEGIYVGTHAGDPTDCLLRYCVSPQPTRCRTNICLTE
jgi:acetate kinase